VTFSFFSIIPDRSRFILCRLLMCSLILCFPSAVYAGLASPLSVSNQSPLVQIHGLPAMGRALLLPDGQLESELSIDVTSHFIRQQHGSETLLLDGESYRYALRFAYGCGDRLEIGLELPYLRHTAGQLDSFIDDWHDVFSLPTAGRENVPVDQLLFFYERSGMQDLALTQTSEGLGDLRLNAAWQLQDESGAGTTAIALHGSLKLPTGESEKLTGSGGLDVALWLSAARQRRVSWGNLTLLGSLGLLALGDGDVLRGQQRSLVGFGGLGFALQPWQRVRLQIQADFHSSFYDQSHLRGVDSASLQLATGGALTFGKADELELAVVEDLSSDTAPDVVFHAAWRHRF